MASEPLSSIAYQDALEADVISKARKLIDAIRSSVHPGNYRTQFTPQIEKLEELLRYTKTYAPAMAIHITTKVEWFEQSAHFLASAHEDVRRCTREAMRAEAASRPPPPSAPARVSFSVATDSAARSLASELNNLDALLNKLSTSSSASSIGSEPGVTQKHARGEEDERAVDGELLACEEAGREMRTYVNAGLVAFWHAGASRTITLPIAINHTIQINKLKYPFRAPWELDSPFVPKRFERAEGPLLRRWSSSRALPAGEYMSPSADSPSLSAVTCS
ncbi:hypothetical protein EV122DRAFT_284776 [Schizophyllum commune]